MRRGSLSKAGLPVVVCAVWAALALPACAQQQAPPAARDLQKQVDALRQQVGSMQKDLDEIKALLAPLRTRMQGPQLRPGALIDLGGRPVKGAASAKVTVVELTDYQ